MESCLSGSKGSVVSKTLQTTCCTDSCKTSYFTGSDSRI